MLYDGAIKFCNQSKQAMADGDFESSYNALMRAQKIVLELSTSLNRDVAPDLCEKLSALYTYIYKLLVDANMQRDPKPVDEAIELLDYERQTWQMLMKQLDQNPDGPGHAVADSPIDVAGAQQTAISSLSVDG